MPRWQNDPWFPDSIWAPRRERDAASLANWREHHETLATLQGEYAAALRVRLEQDFGPSSNHTRPASQPAPRPATPSAAASADNRLQELPTQQLATLHPAWQAALDTPAARDALARLDQFLAQRLQEGATIYPARIFRALEELAPEDVHVVILGQDPYHGPGQAQGLAFSVPDDCPAPPSLRNIFNELAQEYPDRPARRKNDLSDWSRQGVLLLNTSLTVEQGAAGSHARKGWEAVTDALINAVAASSHPKVFLLWGNHAQSKQAAVEAHGSTCKILKSNHPSPLSALRPPRPFIGCGHFTQANTWLTSMGQQAIDWF
ncbi:MAG: uracil-DNA glycosylase [Alcaligenaceae bacterium]|nr:uracil-DNA glycosylase [Alcaligenaceae bacterium]